MKKKIPFDISYREKIESGEVKVVTRDDHPIRIICWDAGPDWPICGLIKDYNPESTYVHPTLFDNEGKCIDKTSKDLFIIVESDDRPIDSHVWEIIKEIAAFQKKDTVNEICEWLKDYCVPILSDVCVADLIADLKERFE